MLPHLRIEIPPLSARVTPAANASTLARLIASGAATTRADLVRATGLARTTVDTGLRALAELGAIRWHGQRPTAGRGRPAELLEIDPAFGVVTVVDVGAHRIRLTVADLGQHVHARADFAVTLADGPAAVLADVVERIDALLAEADLAERQRITVVGVPGPVDTRDGTVVRPPIMPGWDGYPIAERMRQELGGEVLVVNDVNLRALGEARACEGAGPLIYLKVGTGIGAGIVGGDGRLLDGADGAAGEVGHIPVPGSEAVCTCGARGCLEATASVAAMSECAPSSGDAESFLRRVQDRDPAAVATVARGAETIGLAVSLLVHIVNPGRVVLGGSLASASDDLLAGVRSAVYSRALPLATRNLVIIASTLGPEAGAAGGLVLGIEQAFEPCAIERLIERRARRQQSVLRVANGGAVTLHRRPELVVIR